MERKCKNCPLYNRENSCCKIVIFIEGDKINLPVLPDDDCHMLELGIEVNEVKFWTEDETGKKTDGKGIVKIQYPEGFFGNE